MLGLDKSARQSNGKGYWWTGYVISALIGRCVMESYPCRQHKLNHVFLTSRVKNKKISGKLGKTEKEAKQKTAEGWRNDVGEEKETERGGDQK